MAHHLGKSGATVVVADYQTEKMQRTCDELTAIDVPNLGVEVDIRDKAAIDAMVAKTVERFDTVDAIINNAQTFRANAPMSEVSGDDVDVFYQSGVLGTLWAMQAVYPHMKERRVGSHRQLRVVDGSRRRRRGSVRTTRRRRRSALTRTAAREWAPDGIVANVIAPAAAPPRSVGSEHYEEFMRNCPMGRNGDPETDIGPVAHFLCSDACRYLTGHTFMVDGGNFMWS